MEGTELNSILTIMDYAIFGHEVTTQKYVNSAVERRGVEPSYIKPFRLLSIIWVRRPTRKYLTELTLSSNLERI